MESTRLEKMCYMYLRINSQSTCTLHVCESVGISKANRQLDAVHQHPIVAI